MVPVVSSVGAVVGDPLRPCNVFVLKPAKSWMILIPMSCVLEPATSWYRVLEPAKSCVLEPAKRWCRYVRVLEPAPRWRLSQCREEPEMPGPPHKSQFCVMLEPVVVVVVVGVGVVVVVVVVAVVVQSLLVERRLNAGLAEVLGGAATLCVVISKTSRVSSFHP